MTRKRQLLAGGGFFLTIALCLVSLCLASLSGCDSVPAAGTAQEPTELLRKAAKFIEGQKTFSVAIDVEMRLEAQGQKAEMKGVYTLAVARPDRMALRPEKGGKGVVLVSDGKKFWRGVPDLKRYVVSDAPASVSDVFKDPSASLMGMRAGGALYSALLSDHVYDQLMENVTVSRALGVEKIGGEACQRLHFEKEDYDWDAWIETGTKPLIRKVSFQIKKFPGAIGQDATDVKLSLVYDLHDWNLDPKFSEGEFAFEVPEGWDEVEDLTANTEPPHPLLGKPAPEFELEKRGGGTVALKDLQGKVVILDFWATWCPPCVKALPTIAKVAAEYRDRGVVLYAVDLGETAAEVDTFLEEQKLDVPVIFDTETNVAKLYEVSGIPQTVLIGKDGKVQVVHVGLMPDLEKLLSGELDDLIAGKELAGKGKKSEKEEK